MPHLIFLFIEVLIFVLLKIRMKGTSQFHFKQFSVAHDRSTHKVGTDGVLLGAWVNVNGAQRILEIGTGTGVIALMLAQRTNNAVVIDAVEIEKADADQARENVSNSPWPEKIAVHHAAIQNFQSNTKYDLIVSNPPYFINSYLPPEEKRSKARHTHRLSFEELVESTIRLISQNGRLAVILPVVEGERFEALASENQLRCSRKCAFRSRIHKPVERFLMEFAFQATKTATEELTLYSEGEIWSEGYRKLTRDFYLRA